MAHVSLVRVLLSNEKEQDYDKQYCEVVMVASSNSRKRRASICEPTSLDSSGNTW